MKKLPCEDTHSERAWIINRPKVQEQHEDQHVADKQQRDIKRRDIDASAK